ncbi:MAG TPA: BON domain-containing protein [Verrucomicrobiae bacterium]|nr:BON domain-containing protein [Verrucomicrobiae bacterium]
MKRRFLQTMGWTAAATAAIIAVCAGCSTIDNLRGDNQYGADKHMADQVRDALKKDPLYKFPDVTVNVYRDQVQLAGTVNLQAQRQAAKKDAMAVPGVLSVQDNLMVNTNPPVTPE